jgi:hypothetical protein
LSQLAQARIEARCAIVRAVNAPQSLIMTVRRSPGVRHD